MLEQLSIIVFPGKQKTQVAKHEVHKEINVAAAEKQKAPKKRLSLEGKSEPQVSWVLDVCGEQRGNQGYGNMLITKVCVKWIHRVFQIA